MIFIPPPPVDFNNIATQIKYKTEYVSFSSSTKLNSDRMQTKNTLDLTPYLLNKSISTQIENDENSDTNSTWADSLNYNYDIVSKFTYKKTFFVNSKIKSISKFTPKIIIE